MTRNTLKSVLVASATVLVALQAAPAQAGRGSSPQALAKAIASGGSDAIISELERAEHLVCAACVDEVMPLIDSDDVRVRKAAGWWLARRGVRGDVFAAMVGRLGGPDADKARNAADVLGEMQMREAIGPLAAALDSPTMAVTARVAFAQALGDIGDPDAETALGRALGAPEPAVRGAATSALRRLRGFSNGGLVVPLLGDADAGVRIEAIYTLARIRSRAGDGALVGLLGDTSVDVRKKAAWALGEVGADVRVAGPALQKAAAKDENPLVRSLARAAISKLTRSP